MKKWILGIIITLIIIVTMNIFLNNNKPFEREVFVIEKEHYHLYDEKEEIEITYFSNDPSFRMSGETSRAFLYNEEETIKFILSGFGDRELHEEYYNGKTYYGRKMLIKLPQINDTYTLEKAFLDMENIDSRFTLYIGSVHVEYTGDIEQFRFRTMEGEKSELGTLGVIKVGLNKHFDITDIFVGPHRVDYEITDLLLTIRLPEHIKYLSNTYVIIHVDEKITHLPQFNYYFSYELLKSGYHQKYLI